MKSQSAIEFMTIIAIGLILIGTASFFGTDYISAYLRSADVNAVRQTVNSLVSGVNIVYAQGRGAVTEAYGSIPEKVDRSGTYAYDNQINYRFGENGKIDIYDNTKTNIFGTLPTRQGRYRFFIFPQEFEIIEKGHDLKIDGIFLCVEDMDISCIVTTIFDKDYNFENEIVKGENATYIIGLLKKTDEGEIEGIVHEINIQIYYPNKTIHSDYTIHTESFHESFLHYANTIENIQEEGVWIVSAMYPETGIVGAAYFKVKSPFV